MHPTPEGARIYHWHGGLLLLARTLVLDRPTNPIAATLRIALGAPYTIDVEGQTLVTRACLVNSKRWRNAITAIDSELALFYLPIEWPKYGGLRRLLGEAAVVELDPAIFDPIVPSLRAAFAGGLTGLQVKALAARALHLIAPEGADESRIDPRIRDACAILATTPLDQFSVDAVSKAVHLSPSRLRSLFKAQIGYAISEYARWSAVWQFAGLRRADGTFTDAASAAGFFDLAHLDKTFVEVFGMSPSAASDTRFVEQILCD